MPLITTVPRMRREAAPDPVGDPQRHAAEDEGERGHQDRPQPQLRAFERRGRPRPCRLRSRNFANSTIRIAFLAARPISMTTPIWA